MRTGILTLPLDTNYGGILQAWALQTVLQRMGHHVDVFDLKCRGHRPIYMMPLVWAYRAARKALGISDISVFCEYRQARIERHRYEHLYRFYADRINSRPVRSLDQLAAMRYDAIVVGSDQIWREEYIRYLWHSAKTENAFLYQITNPAVKKIAYAASLGIEDWTFTPATTARIMQALGRYDGVSVRERSSVDLLRRNTGTESLHVCDPTMLLSADEYISILDVKTVTDSGIVSYILDSGRLSRSLADTVASATGCCINELNEADETGRFPSVEQWLETIAGARMVITDSYHGCLFSLIFRRPLIFIVNSRRGGARFSSLCSTFGLSRHKIEYIEEFDITQSYALPADIDQRINTFRAKSLNYLCEHLSA